MILNHICSRLVGIVVLLVVSLHETHAFVLVSPFTSGKVLGFMSGDSLAEKIKVSSFQRINDVVRKSSNGLSEWNILEALHLSNDAECSSSFVTSSTTLSAVPTLDPTTLLSDIFSNVLGTPLILAIPVVAALLVATLLAYGIVAYASPAEDEE
jgi:hypothetical protein